MQKVATLTAACAIVLCGGLGASAAGLPERTEVVFHTGSPGGGYMAFGNMFAAEWEKRIPGFVASTVQGAGLTNVVKVEQSEDAGDIGASFNTILMDARKNSGTFERLLDGPIENLRAIGRLNDTAPFLAPTVVGAVPDGVTTVEEFLATEPALRLMTKERGSGGEEFTRRILEINGFGYDAIEAAGGEVTFTTPADGVSAVVNGHADAVWQSFLPHAAILQELESARDVTYLSLNDETVQALQERYGYLPFTAPADWFSTGETVRTARQDTILYVHKDLPEEVVYEMTKVFLANKSLWVKGQKNFETFEPESAWQDTVIELHPGAERAYRELGYM